MHSVKASVAVVGSGIAGLTAAYLLRRRFDVTVYEASDRFGGHARTSLVDGDRVETGFMVFNERTAPVLRRLLDELDVTSSPTTPSLGFRCDGCGLKFIDEFGPRGPRVARHRLLDRRFAHLGEEVGRFRTVSQALAKSLDPATNRVDYGTFLAEHRFDEHFVRHYALPLAEFVWSRPPTDPLTQPAKYLLGFLRHQGLLSRRGPAAWHVIDGGSKTYVDAITALIRETLARTAVTAVTRTGEGVEVSTQRRTDRFDHVVLATHADTALALLTDPTPEERAVLGAFSYSPSRVTLHHDTGVLATSSRARAAWNVRQDRCDGGDRSVSYWMNRIQHLDTARPYVVTMDRGIGEPAIDTEAIVARASTSHPVVNHDSARARKKLPLLNTPATVYAGAHHGWGFHEDGCRSGAAAAAYLGAGW